MLNKKCDSYIWNIKNYKHLIEITKAWIHNTFNLAIFSTAICIVCPYFLLSWFTGDTHWQRTAIITVSVLVVHNTLNVTPLFMILHIFAIIAGFVILFLAKPFPLLYVLVCASMVTLCVYLEKFDNKLRTLGNYTFLPILYTSYQYPDTIGLTRLANAMNFIPYILYSILPVVILAIYDYTNYCYKNKIKFWKHIFHVHRRIKGKLLLQGRYFELLLAMAIAVSLSAFFVEEENIPHGQWLIWSTASIITEEIAIAKKKFKQRLRGALIGVPLGMIIAIFIPPTHYVLNIAALIVVITLAVVKDYVLSFSIRCAGVAFILAVTGGGIVQSIERISNVFIGGIIGLCIFICVHRIMNWSQTKKR